MAPEAARAALRDWVVRCTGRIDATALQRLGELREALASRGVTLVVARARLSLNRAFNRSWVARNLPATGLRRFPTLKAAVHGFERREADKPA